jgi:ATP-dependent DNA helicase DinG
LSDRDSNEERASLAEAITAFFAENGPLAEVLPGYRPRAPQLDMALAVGEALETPGARLVVEAGTGTGKSLAYLVPALLSGQQVCVATGTKALQDQLFDKDLPTVLGAVSDFVGQQKTAALMKGRQNYLCITRWEQFNQSPAFAFAEEARHYERLKLFVEKTQTGDRAEVDGLPEPFSTWTDLDAGSETCVGQQCPAYNDCFVTKMRRTAEKADVVVVNHHLLCADLRVRLEAKAAAGRRADPSLAQVIPDVQAIILDEAHALPDIATDYFGVHFATGRADRLAADIGRHTTKQRKEVVTQLGNAMNRYEMAFEKLLERIGPPATSSERIELAETLADDETVALREQMVSALADLCNRLEGLAELCEDKSHEQNELIGLSRRAEQIAVELGFLLDQALTDKSFVTWLEGKKRGFSLSAAPIDVAAALRATLLGGRRPVVLTSATLAVEGDTRPFEERVGLHLELPAADVDGQAEDEEEDAAALAALDDEDEDKADDGPRMPAPVAPVLTSMVLPSPFDFARRAALYAPSDMPSPKAEAFFERFCDEVRFLTELSEGGALVLFTSYRMMEKTHDAIAPDLIADGLTLLRQGEAPKLKLLEVMREQATARPGAVLFATQSFWEGVDLSGESLRLVVIDRLPFKPPTDPIQRARHQLIESRGQSAFHALSVPEAALSLKQGVGRLIRTERDTGVVAVLDGRLRSAGYGRVFLRTLPPMVRVGSRKVVKQFWDRVVLPNLG